MAVVAPERRFPHSRRFDRREILKAETKTADFTTDVFGTENFDQLAAFLRVSSVSGTSPTLDLVLQTSYDGGENWVDIAAFAQVTSDSGAGVGEVLAAGSKGFAPDSPATSTDGTLTAATVKDWPLGDRCRWKASIGGTNPSFDVDLDQVMRRD